MTLKLTYEELEKKIEELKRTKSDNSQADQLIDREQYKIFFENNHSIMLFIDPENLDIIDANPAAVSFYGWSLEEIKNKKTTDINILTEEQVFREIELAKKEQRNHFLFRHRLSNNEIRDVEVYSGPIVVNGKTLLYSIVHDITERKLAEEKLRKAELKFRLLADYTHDWEYWIDLNGKYVYMSPSCKRITGYSPDEFISNPGLLSQIVKPDYAEKVLHHFSDENNKDTPVFSMEFPIINKNGEKIWLEHHCSPIFDDQGNYIGRRGNNRDITDRKLIQDELQAISLLNESIIDASPIGISIYDTNGNCLSVNEAAAKIVGGTKAQVRQLNYHHLDSWKKSGLYDIAMQAIQEHQKKHHEIKMHTSFNKDIILDIHMVPIRIKDNPHFLIMFDDKTDIKRAEEEKKLLEAQYHQALKMEAVGRLAGGVAHDFNNALSVIMSTAELAMDDLVPEEELYQDLDEILMAAKRARDITRQLLAFARQQTISPRVLDLNESVENMLKMLRRLLGENITIVWMPEENLGMVKMDPTQVDQILANVCINARDAIQGQGEIIIETSCISLDQAYCEHHNGFLPGEFILLSVSDNGCGMSKEILDNVFEPFFTTKDADKGTGLGLATVYGIVKQSNGFVNAYSEPGKGTTIKIYLSRLKTQSRSLDHKKSETEFKPGMGETILVVEDDVSILKIMEKMLKALGYKVLISNLPDMAISTAKEYRDKVHLVITDITMPQMNGRELSKKLQSICPDLKCIFMSGYTANVISHQKILDKGLAFLQKPFSMKVLAETVRKALDN